MRPQGHNKTSTRERSQLLNVSSFIFSSRLHARPVSIFISLSDPTEKVILNVPDSIKEGDNVTLKCQADGNPPPTSFNFYIKVRMHFPHRPAPLGPTVYQVMESLGSSVWNLNNLILY